MKRSQETLFQFHPTHNSILRWAFYMQHPSRANVHKYKLLQGSSLCNTHQHPKTICHYVDLGFLGHVLIFKQSLFQGNFTVKGWIRTVWKVLHKEVASTQLNGLQARNTRNFPKNKNGPYQLGRQQGIKVT